MTPDSPAHAQQTETLTFPIAPGKPTVSVDIPAGSLQQAQRILDMVAPADSASGGQRTYPDGQGWGPGDEVSLAALASLPEETRHTLLAQWPDASAASRPHIAHALHGHCYAAWRDLAQSLADAQEGLPQLGLNDWVPAANVANALVFRRLLDDVLGAEKHTDTRDNLMAAALVEYERGAYPDTAGAEEMDARTFHLTFLPETDYLAADPEEQGRAMAYLLVRSLSEYTGIPAAGLAWRDEPADPVTAFARGHVVAPEGYINAVRLLQTFDPDKLAPMAGSGAAG